MPDFSSYTDRHAWMSSLKVGDYIYDCRNKRLAIAVIVEVQMPKLRWPFLPDWLPVKAEWWLMERYDALCHRFGWVRLVDKDLVLEDGAHCSAMSCCDSYDMDQPVPPELMMDDDNR